jgi:hypothetical protein
MASFQEHCSDCERELGKPYPEVHRFLDQYFSTLGPEKHRQQLHHKNGIAMVRAKFGDEAAKAAEIHIRKDFYGLLPEDSNDVELWFHGKWP